MAKLKGPLFSLGAAGAIGEALVYFPWKGLNVVREYVIPANPKTTGQNTQRGYLREAVASIHTWQAAAIPIDEEDIMAYALWGSTYPTPRTWFNQAVKNFVDQRVAGLTASVLRAGHCTPGTDKLDVAIKLPAAAVDTAGNFHYGTSKTALVNTIAATLVAENRTASITLLTTGVKYFVQYRSTTPANALGIRSGIYYGVPT